LKDAGNVFKNSCAARPGGRCFRELIKYLRRPLLQAKGAKIICREFFLQFRGLDRCERIQARAYVRYEFVTRPPLPLPH